MNHDLTSMSKSDKSKAVLNREQKWAMEGTSHQDWISARRKQNYGIMPCFKMWMNILNKPITTKYPRTIARNVAKIMDLSIMKSLNAPSIFAIYAQAQQRPRCSVLTKSWIGRHCRHRARSLFDFDDSYRQIWLHRDLIISQTHYIAR